MGYRSTIISWLVPNCKRICHQSCYDGVNIGVYTADIAKMYRQILIDKRDVDYYQRILWRSIPDSSIGDYRLLTVTYSTASAPYQALRVLQQVTQEGADFPLAVPVIRQNTYVDDCVFGADDVPLALQTRD